MRDVVGNGAPCIGALRLYTEVLEKESVWVKAGRCS